MNDGGERRLAAVLACRVNGLRLYGKPLQQLWGGKTILEQIVAAMRTFDFVDEVVVATATGTPNLVFEEYAERLGCAHVFGDPDDVLLRLIEGAEAAQATDVLRVTSECPFFDYSMLPGAWERHLERGSDVTVLDFVPLGTTFEIYTVEALRRSHQRGSDADRSELCSNYVRYHQDEFALDILEPRESCRRLDLRLTVDYPEDLIVCRAVAEHVSAELPTPDLEAIIEFLDSRPDLTGLVGHLAPGRPSWRLSESTAP